MSEQRYDMGLADVFAPTWQMKVDVTGRHRLFHGDATQMFPHMLAPQPNIVIADPPALDFDHFSDRNKLRSHTKVFFQLFFESMNRLVGPDAALIMVFRERKGGGVLKNVIGAYAAQEAGWEPFREMIWKTTDADFHRARPCFNNIYIFRRGNMPVQDSEFRYKDVVTMKPPSGSDQDRMIMQMPKELIVNLIRLFCSNSYGYCVYDPFCGTGAVSAAAENLGLPSVAFELNHDLFESLSSKWQTSGVE